MIVHRLGTVLIGALLIAYAVQALMVWMTMRIHAAIGVIR